MIYGSKGMTRAYYCDGIAQFLQKVNIVSEKFEHVDCYPLINYTEGIAEAMTKGFLEDDKIHPRNLTDEEEMGTRCQWCFLAGVRLADIFKHTETSISTDNLFFLATEHGGIFAMDEFINPKYCGYALETGEGAIFEHVAHMAFVSVWKLFHGECGLSEQLLKEASYMCGVYAELSKPHDRKWIPTKEFEGLVHDVNERIRQKKSL